MQAMKYMSQAKIYKSSNVIYNPETEEATSYDWWIFVKRIKGKLVFNNYHYSNSTVKHQHKVRDLLRSLGIKIDLEIKAPGGLQDLASAERWYFERAKAINDVIYQPRTKGSKNIERAEEIKECTRMIKLIQKLGV